MIAFASSSSTAKVVLDHRSETGFNWCAHASNPYHNRVIQIIICTMQINMHFIDLLRLFYTSSSLQILCAMQRAVREYAEKYVRPKDPNVSFAEKLNEC